MLDATKEERTDRVALGGALTRLAALGGVDCAVLLDRDGFPIEVAGGPWADPDVVAGLASSLAEAAGRVARDLDRGDLLGAMVTCRGGALLLHQVSREVILALSLQDPAVADTVRREMVRALPDLVPGFRATETV